MKSKLTGEEIKNKRIKLGITQEQLAARVGVTSATVSRWERGKYTPHPLIARHVLEFLETNLKTSAQYTK
jgi:transcriptional regulator with XRE-family HTH domain